MDVSKPVSSTTPGAPSCDRCVCHRWLGHYFPGGIRTAVQSSRKTSMYRRLRTVTLGFAIVATTVTAQDTTAPAGKPAAFDKYKQKINQTSVKIEMLPIPGGKFLMGSPTSEPKRKEDEGPQRTIEVEPFWMSKTEITWAMYDVFGEKKDIRRRELMGLKPTKLDPAADAVTRPTPPYTDMSFGMGKGKYPAICMTQHAARKYCEWLSAKTGHYYRLPTEAE